MEFEKYSLIYNSILEKNGNFDLSELNKLYFICIKLYIL